MVGHARNHDINLPKYMAGAQGYGDCSNYLDFWQPRENRIEDEGYVLLIFDIQRDVAKKTGRLSWNTVKTWVDYPGTRFRRPVAYMLGVSTSKDVLIAQYNR